MAPLQPPLTVPSTLPQNQTLIILHPLAQPPTQFAPSLLSLTTTPGATLQTLFPHTTFLFPTATSQCATALHGRRLPQWFDCFSTHKPEEREALQIKGLREGCVHLHSVIDEGGEGGKGVWVGGVGMGAAMAVVAVLGYRGMGRVRGVLGWGGWLPLRGVVEGCFDGEGEEGDQEDVFVGMNKTLRAQLGLPDSSGLLPDFKNMPVWLGHGEKDEDVPLEVAADAASVLEKLGMDVTFKIYEGTDSNLSSGTQFDDLAAFLRTQGVT